MTERASTNYNQILRNLNEIKNLINEKPVTLVAVTKNVTVEKINFAIENGVRCIGENRVQEFLEKYPHYKKDNLTIHFIGHLQRNKVRQIIGKVDMIESVDSLPLAEEISRQAEKFGCVVEILLQVNPEKETTKSGFFPENIFDAMLEIAKLKNLKISGLMSIPSPGCENSIYQKLYKLFVDIQAEKVDNINMKYLSVGMSGDYEKAISHGANIIRLGSAIFGSRNI